MERSVMSDSAKAPQKDCYFIIEFKFGDPAHPSYKRYTDWTSNVFFQGNTYESRSEIEVKAGKRSGNLNEEHGTLVMPIDSFIDSISRGEPHSRIFSKVTQFMIDKNDAQGHVVHLGRVMKTVRNFEGRKERVKLELSTWKDMLKVSLGLGANRQCPWTFGQNGCFLVPQKSSGILTSISGADVVITGVASKPNRFWHKGYIALGGLQITIRNWKQGTSFTLINIPPADWLNQSVTVVEGCDKLVKTCESKDNLEHFAGFGIAMPKYNPQFEGP